MSMGQVTSLFQSGKPAYAAWTRRGGRESGPRGRARLTRTVEHKWYRDFVIDRSLLGTFFMH